jgi:Domain of unknown function (DUF4296)
MRWAIIICLLLICSAGCRNKDKVVLDKEKMQVVLWDILQANQLTTLLVQKDSLKDPVMENAQLQKQIFDHYKTTREQFYYSYTYYKAHPELLQEVVDSLIVKQEAQVRTQNPGNPQPLPHQFPQQPLHSIFNQHGQGPFKR